MLSRILGGSNKRVQNTAYDELYNSYATRRREDNIKMNNIYTQCRRDSSGSGKDPGRVF
jgi:hypothetical protein